MTTVGRWSPNKVRARVLDGTWVSPPEELGGMVLLTPTSIAYTGTSANIGANGSVTFSSCDFLSLNGIFSSTYDNYQIVLSYVDGATTGYRLRASGTDDTTTSYVDQTLQASSTTVSVSRISGDTAGRFSYARAAQPNGNTTTIFGPHLTQPTALRSVNIHNESGARLTDWACTHSQSVSYDGFTILGWDALGGTLGTKLSGTVSVYGLVGA